MVNWMPSHKDQSLEHKTARTWPLRVLAFELEMGLLHWNILMWLRVTPAPANVSQFLPPQKTYTTSITNTNSWMCFLKEKILIILKILRNIRIYSVGKMSIFFYVKSHIFRQRVMNVIISDEK
jgi:hypothetical protein